MTVLDFSREPGRPSPSRDMRAKRIVAHLDGRSLVLVGMMGAGKTSVGRRLAQRLGLEFVDADVAIETAARMTIPEIFERHGEPFFRDREHRVITRLLTEGQKVLATGGGAFMLPETRDRIGQYGVSVWLKAEFDVLMRRVRKRSNRPLLQSGNPEETLQRLIDQRYGTYALADITVESRDGPHDSMVEILMSALEEAFIVEEAEHPPVVVPVELGNRAYDILIGRDLIARSGQYIGKLAPGATCAIVTDENVAARHLTAMEASLDSAGIKHRAIVVKPGEASKNYQTFESVCDELIAARMERNDLVIALGGGVIGDLAGFAASCVRRGIPFVQVPTSLLAQVDSSVGGKTAINSPHGKNLVGAFYQPALVLADIGALQSLPEREFRAGYAEVAKYGLINDPDFFYWLEANWKSVFAFGPELTQAIATSCRSKASVVARDETEKGDRALLNLGHTFGHALESLTMYDSRRLVHGEGVAIGVCCAYRFSAMLGHCTKADADRVAAHFHDVGLPTRIRDISGWNADENLILDAMYQDKKVSRGALTFILAHGIGQSFVAKNVPADDVRRFLAGELRTG